MVGGFLAYDLQLARRLLKGRGSFIALNFNTLLQLIKLAAPLGIVMALSSLNANIPRYVLQRYRGGSDLGIFAAIAYLVVVVGLVANALGQSAAARLSKNFADGRMREFVGLLKRMSFMGLGIAGAGVILAIMFGHAILRLLYGPVYATHIALLILLIATSAVTAVAAFLGFGLTAARQFRAQVPIIAVTVATCTAFAVALTPRWGLMGSGFAVLIAASVQVLGSLIVLWNAIRHSATGKEVADVDVRLAEREAVALFGNVGE